jgi:predicted DNA-binding antitoxin AbrB/MazE fold protein
MTITIDAVYEGGVLKPSEPLPLNEHDKVRLMLEPLTATEGATHSWVEASAGILAWQGDPEQLRRLAEEDEFGMLGSPRLSLIYPPASRFFYNQFD